MVTQPYAAPLAMLMTLLPSLPRSALSDLVEKLIDRLDDMDGDADLEDDDPAGGAVDDEGEEVPPLHLLRPRYGIDQTAGAINEPEAYHAYHEWDNARSEASFARKRDQDGARR